MADDFGKELTFFNHEIKELMHHANNEYKCNHQVDLYDIAKSERFPFLPHIGLGRIRSMSIKQHIKDSSQVDKILEQIKQRIKKEALKIVKISLTTDNQKISFNRIGLFDLQKRDFIKEYVC